MQKIAEDYVDQIDVVAIYISEAHATDEWALYSDVTWKQPQTLEERLAIASKYAGNLHGTVPLFVDTMSNALGESFAAWPERLDIIGASGTIVYKGELGPDGYHPEEVRAWLEQNVTAL